MIVMTGVEDGRLLKLKGTSACAHNFAYHAHQNEGTLSSSLLWHARFGHINYDNLRLLKKWCFWIAHYSKELKTI